MNQIEETYLDMANTYKEQGNYEKALIWYKKIKDNADVYELIGECLYKGKGCGKNVDEAKEYFKKAADMNNTDAMCNLALCLDDLDEKLYWYKKAADSGLAYAMNMVGIILEDINDAISEESIEWYKKAADAGSDIGCYNYAMNVTNDDDKIAYIKKAAEKELLIAMKEYAEYLTIGLHCGKDIEKANELKLKIRRVKTAIDN